MDRRTCFTSLAVLSAAAVAPTSAASNHPIRLYIDLEVASGREEEMVSSFHKGFEPVIREQPGFVDVLLMKLSREVVGKNPIAATYRLAIVFETDEQRVTWVATDDHKNAWAPIANTLTGMKLNALLFEQV